MRIEDAVSGRVVLDEQRQVIGRIKEVHLPGQYVSPANKKPVMAMVMEMESGESFVAEGAHLDRFKTLDGAAEQFFVDVQTMVAMSTKAMCAAAKNLGIEPKTCFLILGRCDQVQAGLMLKPDPAEDAKEGWDV